MPNPTSPLTLKHQAETKKFEAETEDLKAEASKFVLEAQMARLELEEAVYHQQFHDNLDHRHRTYSMVGAIDDDTITELVENVNTWGRMSKDPIVIRLNSPGGDVTAGLALYDQLKAIDQYKAPITTVALGMTASMAGILFQAGRKRIISRNATFLIHEVSVTGISGVTRSEMEDITDSIKRMNLRLYGILAERSTMSVEEIDVAAKRKDWEINADDAVRLGFADVIGYE